MKVLITGGGGFLGAWIARRLLGRGFAIKIFDLADNRELVRSIVGDSTDLIEWRCGDIRRLAEVADAAQGCDALIHLAAVLTPACRDDPVFGAEVNLLGTLHAFEAAKKHRIGRVVYASSGGVFGPEPSNEPVPTTHYGAFKLACEGCARAYWEDAGVSSLGIRPFVVYGPGRETGLTAGPSLACKAAARGMPYTVPYTGLSGMVYVDDVAAAYELALLNEYTGAHVINQQGQTVDMDEILAEIRRCVPDARVSAAGPHIPSAAVAPSTKGILGDLPETPLSSGIEQTIDFYRRAR